MLLRNGERSPEWQRACEAAEQLAWSGTLLDDAVTRLGASQVDVNEQNPKALGFYLKQGFAVAGRSPLDGGGRPFPILHLRLQQPAR